MVHYGMDPADGRGMLHGFVTVAALFFHGWGVFFCGFAFLKWSEEEG